MSDSTGDAISLLDTLPDRDAPDPEQLIDQSELRDRIADAIAALPEREKLVVALYYYENLTLREIGEVLGVTESRVSQLHTKAVLRLRVEAGRRARLTVDTKGFFASLFDISFSSLITTKVIKVLYVISLVVIGVAALFFIVAAFASSPAAGVLTLLIIAPLFALLYVVYTRVILEFIIVVFRIAEYTHELVELTRAQAPGRRRRGRRADHVGPAGDAPAVAPAEPPPTDPAP